MDKVYNLKCDDCSFEWESDGEETTCPQCMGGNFGEK